MVNNKKPQIYADSTDKKIWEKGHRGHGGHRKKQIPPLIPLHEGDRGKGVFE